MRTTALLSRQRGKAIISSGETGCKWGWSPGVPCTCPHPVPWLLLRWQHTWQHRWGVEVSVLFSVRSLGFAWVQNTAVFTHVCVKHLWMSDVLRVTQARSPAAAITDKNKENWGNNEEGRGGEEPDTVWKYRLMQKNRQIMSPGERRKLFPFFYPCYTCPTIAPLCFIPAFEVRAKCFMKAWNQSLRNEIYSEYKNLSLFYTRGIFPCSLRLFWICKPGYEFNN